MIALDVRHSRMTCVFSIFLFLHSDDDQILIQTESIGDGMIDAVEEIIDENPRPSPSAIIVLVSLFYLQNTFYL